MLEQPTGKTTRPRWLLPLIGCSIAGLAIILLVGSIGGYLLFTQLRPAGFDAERWRQATMGCDPDNPRLGMFRDLEEKLLRERPTRAEVIALLGDTGGQGNTDTLTYMLGYNIIDCDSVLIFFGSDGRVNEVRYSQG